MTIVSVEYETNYSNSWNVRTAIASGDQQYITGTRVLIDYNLSALSSGDITDRFEYYDSMGKEQILTNTTRLSSNININIPLEVTYIRE
jgi:hypothetical protein